MVCQDFIYDEERLSDYGFIICSFGGSDSSWSGGDINFTTIKAPDSDIHTFYTSSTDEPLSCTFSICKNPCGHSNFMTVTREEYSSISRWLKRSDGFHWLQFDNEWYEDIYFNSKFNVQPHQVGNETIGFDLTINTDSPYAYGKYQEKDFSLTKDIDFSFKNYSDKTGNIYPVVTITPQADGKIDLLTGVESRPFQRTLINNEVKRGKTIILDGNNDYINGIDNPNNFNFEFPVISNTYNDRVTYFKLNTGSVDCDIKIEYRLIRMVVV